MEKKTEMILKPDQEPFLESLEDLTEDPLVQDQADWKKPGLERRTGTWDRGLIQ